MVGTLLQKTPSAAEEDGEWRAKFGAAAAAPIRACVAANVPHYDYLRSFALRF